MDSTDFSLLLRLLPKVDRSSGACWTWKGATTRGRPVLSFKRGGKYSLQEPHRVIFRLFVGPLREREPVFRTCGNPLCVRPDHLTTAKDKAGIVIRFLSLVDIGEPCWAWKGAVNESGYAVYTDPDTGSTKGAYRLALRMLGGVDITDHHVHHVCQNRLCVRPDHLVKRTPEEHASEHPEFAQWVTGKKRTHCKRGHEFTLENTITRKNGRQCRACENAGQRAAYERRRQRQKA